MEIRITYSRDGGRERALPEETFVKAIAGTLWQLGEFYERAAQMRQAEEISAAGATIASHGMADFLQREGGSLLATFGSQAAQLLEAGAVPPMLVCPCCSEDQMDRVEPQDDGSFECQTCKARYSGDTDGGRPSWKQSFNGGTGDYLPRLYYVPAFDRYVSIPDGD